MNAAGAGNRHDLFTPSSARSQKSIGGIFPEDNNVNTRPAEPSTTSFLSHGQPEETNVLQDDPPLELEHMIGYTGHYRSTMLFHPKEEGMYISR